VTARQLKKMLRALGVSQRATARVLEISERQMRRYCAGDAKIPQAIEFAMLWIRAGSREGFDERLHSASDEVSK
jgi:hypothetical protein